MYVGRIMHRNLITVSPDSSIKEATDLLEVNHIEHLLVVDASGQMVGILSDRDIKHNLASPATTFSAHELNYLLDQMNVGTIMIKEVITVTPDTTVEEAAQIIRENEISSLPVMRDGKPVGIVTKTDVMGVLMDALGLGGSNARIIVLVKNRIGVLADVCTKLRDERININSLITWPEKDLDGVFQLVIRVREEKRAAALSAMESLGLKVLTSYQEDHEPFVNY